MDDVVVEPVHWSDLDRMAELELRCFPLDAWSAPTFWAELAQRPRREYLLARTGSVLLGYAGLDHGDRIADVMTLTVDPARRGQGLGRVLLRALHRAAAGRGAEAVMLEVRADNTRALRLYRDHGYREVRRRHGYYRSPDGGPGVDALVMRREVGND